MLDRSPYMIFRIEISRYSLQLKRSGLTRSNNVLHGAFQVRVKPLAWC